MPISALNQPQGLARVNRSHALARNLVGAFIPGQGRDYEIVTGTKFGTFGTRPTIVAAPIGMGWQPGSYNLPMAMSAQFGPAQVSVIAIVKRVGSIGNYQRVIDVGGDGSTSGGWDIEATFNDGLNLTAWNNGSPVNGTNIPLPINSISVLGFTNNGSVTRSYLNAQYTGQVGASMSVATASAKGPIGIASDRTGGSSSPNVIIYGILVFNRVLSDAEIAKVSANPWQLFDAPSQTQFPMAAAAGGNATASPSGVSASSAVGSATVSGQANAAPSGVSATAAVGTASASGQGNAAPAGVSATASVGTATASGTTTAAGTASPLGVAATASVGAAAATGQGKAAPAGVSATAAVGTPFATGQAITTAYPAGVQAVASVGIATGRGTAVAAPMGVMSQIFVGEPYAYGPFDASSYPKFYAFTLMRADPVSASGAMQGTTAQFTLMRSNPLYAASAMSDAPLNRSVNLI